MTEIGLIAPLGGLVVIALFYMRRIAGGAAATAWGSAWLALYVAGMIQSLPEAPVVPVAVSHVLGTLFCALLYAGAVAFRDGGALPRRPLQIGFALGVVRGLLYLVGERALSHAIAVPLELPFSVGAVVATWQAARWRRSFPELLLPPTLALLAVVNAADPIFRVVDINRVPLVIGWDATAFSAALLQIAAFVERGRDRERQLLLERNLLYRVARAATETRGRRPALEAVVRAVQEAQWFDVFGIWVASPDGRFFERAARVGIDEPALSRFDRISAKSRELRPVLETAEPVLIARRGDSGHFADLGLGDVAAVALRAHGRTLGLAATGLAPDRHFGQGERELLGSIARELALVLAHVDAAEERELRSSALRDERRQLRALVEAVPVGILLVDRDDRIQMLSRVGAEHFGLGPAEDWAGRPLTDTVPAYASRLSDESRSRLAAVIARHEGTFDSLELRFTHPAVRVVRLSARPVRSQEGDRLGRVFVSLDVTAERQVAERLQHAQRMETLGTLASGIAHDFNNQLAAILGNARRVESGLPAASAARAPLADIEAAAEHCAELTRGLLDLAREAPPMPRPVEVDKVVREVEAVLRTSLAPNVRLCVDVEPGLLAHAESAQLRRVLTNLVLNARDAVGTRGEIEIAARRVDGDAARLELRVRDTGAGMDPSTLARAFDPFFTTKPAGQGTGLGLAIVQRIADSHGASVEVGSEPGRGTLFRILWPAAREASAVEETADAAVAAEGHECVLLAEDEPSLRRLARAGLERHGYRVLEAADGEDALAVFTARPSEVDALVLDLAMPRRGGLEVLGKVRAQVPEMPAVVMTGHATAASDGALPAGVVLLVKPFAPDALADAVRRALDARA